MFKKYRVLLLLTAAWMMGTGFRFIMMQPTDIYVFSWFDKFFDWGILFGLGVILFLVIIRDYLREKNVKEM